MARLVPASSSLSVSTDEYRRLFGPGLNQLATVQHLQLGGPQNQSVALKLTCDGGVPNSITFQFFILGSEIRAGNGGRIRVSVRRPLPTGLPDMDNAPLATATWSPRLSGAVPAGFASIYRTFYFSDVKAVLDFNQVYFFVLENIASNPSANYLSVGVNVSHSLIGEGNRFAYRFDNNLYTKRGANPWRNATISGIGELKYHPQYQLVYSDGRAQGSLLKHTNSDTSQTVRLFSVQGNRMFREKIRLPVKKVISGLSFSCACNSPGELEWAIKKAPNSTMVSGRVAESVANYRELSGKVGFQKWYDIELASDVTLDRYQEYYLEFKALAGEWLFAATSHAVAEGGLFPAVFSISNAQTKTGALWAGYNVLNNYVAYNANAQYVFHTSDHSAPSAPGTSTRRVSSLPANSPLAIVSHYSSGVAFRFVTVNNGVISLTQGEKPERATGTLPAIYVPMAGTPVAGRNIGQAQVGELVLRAGAWPVNTQDGQLTILHNNQATAHNLSEQQVDVGATQSFRAGTLEEAVPALKPAFVVTKPVTQDLRVEGAFVWTRNGETLSADEAATLPSPVPLNRSLEDVLVYGTFTNRVPRWDARMLKVTYGSTDEQPNIPAGTKGYQVVNFRISMETNNRIFSNVNKMVGPTGALSDATGQFDLANALTIGNPPPPPPPPPPVGDNYDTSAIMTAAIRNTEAGHDQNFQYPGWVHEGAPGVQGRGGSVAQGGSWTMASMKQGQNSIRGPHNGECMWGSMTCEEASQFQNTPFDLLSPWGCLIPGAGQGGKWANFRNCKFYILYQGENTWIKIIDDPDFSATGYFWAAYQGSDMKPYSDQNVPYFQNGKPPPAPWNRTNGYIATRTPDSDRRNNHFGLGDFRRQDQFLVQNTDATRVEGTLMLMDGRLDPRNPTAEIALQMGSDFKMQALPKSWYPGLGLTRLVRLTPDWQTIAWVNADSGQDAGTGGRVLSRARLMQTVIPR